MRLLRCGLMFFRKATEVGRFLIPIHRYVYCEPNRCIYSLFLISYSVYRVFTAVIVRFYRVQHMICKNIVRIRYADLKLYEDNPSESNI